MMWQRFVLPAAVLAISLYGSGTASAQVLRPGLPDKLEVEFRYELPQSNVQNRIVQYRQMVKDLAALGFAEEETILTESADINPAANRMLGSLPGKNLEALLRVAAVKAAVARPAGTALPDDPAARVKLEIDIVNGYPPVFQRRLADQTLEVLESLGFREALGYDRVGDTRLRGTIPAGELPKLLKDLRSQPSGWFLPARLAEQLPEPLRDASPLRYALLTPEPAGLPPLAPRLAPLPPYPPEFLGAVKFGPELRRLLALEGAADKPLRVEVIRTKPIADSTILRRDLAEVDRKIVYEGQLGSVQTYQLPRASLVNFFAAQPDVVAVRLPNSAVANEATAAPLPPPKAPEKKEIEQMGAQLPDGGPALLAPLLAAPVPPAAPVPLAALNDLAELQRLGNNGKGTKIVVVDTDFRGAGDLIGKGLGATTGYIDYTAEKNSSILPDAYPSNERVYGQGAQVALAIQAVAPEAQLILVRIDPTAPHQVQSVGRFARGATVDSESLKSRRDEVEYETGILTVRRSELTQRYRLAYENFDEEGAGQKAREDVERSLRTLNEDEAAFRQRLIRLDTLTRNLALLGGADFVYSAVNWLSGYPMSGASALSQFLSETYQLKLPSVVRRIPGRSEPQGAWVQAAGDTYGQVWSGVFRDADRNGVMEFAPADVPLPGGKWSRELNFLAFAPNGKRGDPVLPAGAKLRLTVQWLEAHDPDLDESEFRAPLSNLQLTLVQQRDPSGRKLPSDDLEFIGRTEGLPIRLSAENGFAVYEMVLEFEVTVAARYAIRVEGTPAATIRPESAPTIPEQTSLGELRLRLAAELLDIATAKAGRVVFADFVPEHGGGGMPADSAGVVTIGTPVLTPGVNDLPRVSAFGSGPEQSLRIKPDYVLADDLIVVPNLTQRGSAISGAFAAGIFADLHSANIPLLRVRNAVPKGSSLLRNGLHIGE